METVLIFTVLFFLLSSITFAKDYDKVIIIDNVTYGCYATGPGPSPNVPAIEEKCQYYADDGSCIYMAKRYLYKGKYCDQMCQHYDSYYQICRFETRCTVEGNYLCRTVCDRYDSYEDRCLTTKKKCLRGK